MKARSLKPRPLKSRLAGFTLVELLVVIAIIGVFMAMLLPAVQAAREAARRSSCQNKLLQLMLAVQNYQSAQESLPSGVVDAQGPIRSVPAGYHHNWVEPLLVYLDEGTLHDRIDTSVGVYEEANAPVRKIRLAPLVCPSENETLPASNYAGCHHDVEAPIDADNHGVLFLNSRVAEVDLSDGLAHTIFLGEKIVDTDDLGWMSGTRATLRNTGSLINSLLPGHPPGGSDQEQAIADARAAHTYIGGFGSYHPGAAMFGFGDGSVQVLSDEIDPKLFRQLGNRSDGEVTDDAALH